MRARKTKRWSRSFFDVTAVFGDEEGVFAAITPEIIITSCCRPDRGALLHVAPDCVINIRAGVIILISDQIDKSFPPSQQAVSVPLYIPHNCCASGMCLFGETSDCEPLLRCC